MQTAEGEGVPPASVVVSTGGHPDSLAACLAAVTGQTEPPAEIIVVDSSTDDRSYLLVAQEFPGVNYVRNPGSPRLHSTAWELGLSQVTSPVVAFIDDASSPTATWLAELVKPYRDPNVGGVGGRVTAPGATPPAASGDRAVGEFGPDGSVSVHFDVDTGTEVPVQYLPGSNMSFRVEALHGLESPWADTAGSEAVELSLSVGAAGWKLIYRPTAAVAGPDGSVRQQNRYEGRRDGTALLARRRGLMSPELRRYVLNALRSESGAGRAGTAAGAARAIRRAITRRVGTHPSPIRPAATKAER